MGELMSTERTYVDHLLQMVALFLRFKVRAIFQMGKSREIEKRRARKKENEREMRDDRKEKRGTGGE